MLFAPLTVLWRLTLFQKLHNQVVQNTFHFLNKSAIEDDEDFQNKTLALAPEFKEQATNSLRLFQNTQLFWTKATAAVIIPHLGPFSETIFESVGGSQANESLPSYCAAVVSVRTGFSGRSKRGRIYIAGVGMDAHVDSEINGENFSTLIEWTEEFRNWFNPVTGGQKYIYVHYSRKLGRDPLGHASMAGVFGVQAMVARKQLKTQRHRLVGHGP